METSTTTDDDGESAGSFTFRIFFFTFIFLLACSKTQKKNKAISLRIVQKIKSATKVDTPVAAKPVKKKKKIYLTFDDGPNKGTRNVLDIVQQEDIPVTFFIVGEHVFASREQAMTWDSLLAAKNIEICNHSYTHALHNSYEKFYEKPDTVIKDMKQTQEKLLPDNNIVRAPGRNSWRIDSLQYTEIKKSKAAIDSLHKAGFTVMGWDLEWHYDPKTFTVKNTSDELLNQVDSVFNNNKTKVADNLVLLAHDQVYAKSNDSFQLREFIKKLKLKDDYELSLAKDYPGVIKTYPDSVKTKTTTQ